MEKSKKIVIGISGSGTNMKAIIRKIEAGYLDASVAFVFSDNPDAVGLKWAKEKGYDTHVIDHKAIREELKTNKNPEYFDESFIISIYEKCGFIAKTFGGDIDKQLLYLKCKIIAEDRLIKLMESYETGSAIGTIVLAGYMQLKTPYLIDYMHDRDGSIINIHPALLPSFPGEHGYEDTYNHGCKEGGCTVHYVDEGEDSGPIIGQMSLPILPEDDEESFKARGLQNEYILYPECLKWHLEGKLRIVEVKQRNGSVRKVVKRRY